MEKVEIVYVLHDSSYQSAAYILATRRQHPPLSSSIWGIKLMTVTTSLTGRAEEGASLGSTYGSLLVGTIFSGMLYGVTSLQSIHYFTQYGSRDRRTLKVLVSVLWTLDTLIMVLNFHAAWHYFVISFNDSTALRRQTWSLDLESICTGLVIFLCQMFFVIRIRRFHRGLHPDSVVAIWTFYFLTLLAVVAFVTSIAITVIVFLSPVWITENTKRMQSLTIGNVVVGAVLDVLITIVLCTILDRHRSGLKSTDSLINRLMTFMITRGIVTTIIQGLTLITFLAFPSNLIWVAFHLSASKVYANAVLATLNSRTPRRGADRKSHDQPALGSSWHGPDPNARATSMTVAFQILPDLISSTTPTLENSRT